jgi:hypothetical protein
MQFQITNPLLKKWIDETDFEKFKSQKISKKFHISIAAVSGDLLNKIC